VPICQRRAGCYGFDHIRKGKKNMELFGESLTVGSAVLLALAMLLALGFEFVNGFHDTANAVATVIYTNSLRPTVAVVWSGLWNLIGVLVSGGAVAFGIVALLPVELVLNVGSGAGFAMVFALLATAILWNLGTWSLGLPASSSHTLIGSILGVGLANSLLAGGEHFGEGVNWGKAQEVFASLLLSPLIGFVLAGGLLLLARLLLRRPELYRAPAKDTPPPLWIRALLVLTCTGVSFAHGSNDGQKGMGLVMLILIGLLPGAFALNPGLDASAVQAVTAASRPAVALFAERAGGTALSAQQAEATLSAFLKSPGQVSVQTYAALNAKSAQIADRLTGRDGTASLPRSERIALRSDIYLVSESITRLDKQHLLEGETRENLLTFKSQLDGLVRFIPDWVKVIVACALGFGTMIGWERIVVTVGEKIGKEELSYGQGAAAELVAMSTIIAADRLGLPVSTTHVLSSGIAGTMAANRSGLQAGTVRNILLAWVLTLPACVTLGALAFLLNHTIAVNLLGWR
jgi:PiT family inorganic phosphate transporter